MACGTASAGGIQIENHRTKVIKVADYNEEISFSAETMKITIYSTSVASNKKSK